MKQTRLALIGLLALFTAACVTINIYFPAAAADAAAEKIVDDIIGRDKQQAPQPQPEGDDKGAFLAPIESTLFALNPLEWLIPSAHAASPDFNIDTPRIRQLRAEMKARHEQLKPFYTSGKIGYTSDGMVAQRDGAQIALRERGLINNLLAAENRDRDALYKAIAAANGHPEWEGQVRTVFADKWIERAPAGWWYQAVGGEWRQK
jgi:uncharacterized protein YdbL (DUF1318 family)